ncbi:MAG: bi-domain-containing oxidoreductase [Thermodesulfobacteriota bacterium]|nr:bi-domain-containing oxidoreductase [Thermodesulfobacteriota bacterium]
MVKDVPAAMLSDGRVLVRLLYSCISSGTELAGIKNSAKPLWKRVVEQPHRVIHSIKDRGLSNSLSIARSTLEAEFPMGYSAAGRVVGSKGAKGFPEGGLVAVGGQFANHAELVCVPKNLVVKVPDNLAADLASTVTIGAIALQGIRRLQPTLGETFVVIGLGAIGQIVGQLLKANGCKALGIDTDDDRVNIAASLGMRWAFNSKLLDPVQHTYRLTMGHGADGVVICASTPSDEVISTAFNMCRKKGRVVLIGDIGLNLNRSDFYSKELDFFISTSYGPGRYDTAYEENGMDYPIGYVRWTENRNMSAYLDLLANKSIDVASLISDRKIIDEAPQAYAQLSSGAMMVLLEYPEKKNGAESLVIKNSTAEVVKKSKIGISLIGAGNFALSNHLPNIKRLSDRCILRGVMSRSGHKVLTVSKRYDAAYATTDINEILDDRETDAVIICTRHNLHAEYALLALRAGKHVFVEKPLAVKRKEMEEICAYFNAKENSGQILMAGFNRRFAPFIRRIKEVVEKRTNPLIINYRMNAGYIPSDSWVHGPEGGGRNIGEACHIYDLFTYIVGSKFTSVQAAAISKANGYYLENDNFIATITFEDGSVANLVYTAMGSRDLPKERMEIYVDGMIIELNDYKSVDIHGSKLSGFKKKNQDKGLFDEMHVFCDALISGGHWPIELWEQIQATEIALQVEEIIQRR